MLVSNMPAVVVGYDGSPTATGALLFAADEAVRRRRPLRVVCAREGDPAIGGRAEADDLLWQAAMLVHATMPADGVVLKDPCGAAGLELISESFGAELLVVGRGEIGPLGAVLGSVALDVVCGAGCPVVVIGDGASPHVPHTGAVVVGVDLAGDATDELLEGFTEARMRGRDLVVLLAWQAQPGSTWSRRADPDRSPGDVEEHLREVVRPFRDKEPDVKVTEICRVGPTLQVLGEVGLAASLIVLGARGLGLLSGVLLGSTGQALARHAPCPLLIARPRRVS
jgi:nucleotide-binding universal stress UspA family protein